jgi:hypothetical protein
MPTVAEDIFGIWGEIERDGTHIGKKFDCSKQNFSGASYMFFAVFRIWAHARHLALAKKPNGAVNAGGLPTKMEQFVWCHFFRKG